MKIRFEEHKQRISLLLLLSAFSLLFLLVTIAIVGSIVFFLIYGGALQPVKTDLSAQEMFGYLILVSVVIGALLSILLRFPLKPVNKVLNAMSRLASGDYSVRLSFKGPLAKHPTFAELTNSFNRMASELEHTEMLRSDFINNLSHEFKTPIVSIAGFAKLLKRGNLPPEKQTEYLSIIEEESMRLSQMATNVLNLTRVENQSILTDICKYNLSEQLRTCVLVLESKWEKKQIGFALPEGEVFLSASEELLKQVWINLIDNAIKFSAAGGTVEIKVAKADRAVTVEVANFGQTIPPAARQRIFNKFYQADESHATEGNGIGLAVVKKIVDLHGGSVAVSSENGRTAFTVTIPQKN